MRKPRKSEERAATRPVHVGSPCGICGEVMVVKEWEPCPRCARQWREFWERKAAA